MWITFVTARLLIFLSFQPRLVAALLRSCSVVNSLTRRAGLSPAFQPTSLAQPLIGKARFCVQDAHVKALKTNCDEKARNAQKEPLFQCRDHKVH